MSVYVLTLRVSFWEKSNVFLRGDSESMSLTTFFSSLVCEVDQVGLHEGLVWE
jgi:hypothetical protein